MPHPAPSDPTEGLHAGLLGLHQLQRCLYGLGGVPCFILRHTVATERLEWWELLRDDRRLRPFDFEFQLGRPEVRDAYHQDNLARVRRIGRAHVSELHGFRDLYVPLAVTQHTTLVLYAGQWAADVPSYDALCRSWRELSGRDAAPADPLFRRWLRVCLEVPVLAPEQVRGLTALGRAVARLGTGAPLSKVQQSIERLRRRVFALHAVDHNWIASAVDLDGLTRPPWGLDPELDPRLVEELGLERRPSVVGVLTLDRRRVRSAPLEEQVLLRRLQHEATRLCRKLESCLAAPLQDGSVIVALSLDPRVRGKHRVRRFAVLVRELQRSLLRTAGLPTTAGLGLEVLPGAGLGESYRQATTALRAALEAGEELGRYDPRHDDPGNGGRTGRTPAPDDTGLVQPSLADREERLRGAIEWIERHLDDSSPLDAAARQAGLAPSSFRRAFRAARGQSFGVWLRSTRLQAARTLLANEDLPVTTVARRVGFGEVHAFIRNFRELTGKTPGAYRREILCSEGQLPKQ